MQRCFMITHNKISQCSAIGLAILAGMIDALGFLSLGGFFLSFMSGNSTRFAAGIVHEVHLAKALLPLGIIGLFVLGVMVGRVIRFYRPKSPSRSVLFVVTVLLSVAGILQQIAVSPIPLMVLAMGASNNVFVREGEVAIGVTYMTGTLVKFAQRLAARLLGDRKSQWLPYLLLWMGLVLGAVFGAAAYAYFGIASVWIAAALAGVLTVAAWRIDDYPLFTAR